mmetsp:Transcript_25176/g.57888  ORF Transcript_25176/g.57888 Transcript_25176/m.57888 type:complete len:874 (+) Transcript_25176:104-2725(+)
MLCGAGDLKSLVGSHVEVVSTEQVEAVIDATGPQQNGTREVKQTSATVAVLVISKARPTEAAILAVRQVGCLGPRLVCAVPVCMNIGVTLKSGQSVLAKIDAEVAGRKSRRTSPTALYLPRRSTADTSETVTFLLKPTEEIVPSRLRPEENNFVFHYKKYHGVAKRHGYVFSSHMQNHDWLWSYDADTLPRCIRYSPKAVTEELVPVHRHNSLVIGGINLRSLAQRHGGTVQDWRSLYPLLKDRQEDYRQDIPLQVSTVTMNCAGRMPPRGKEHLHALFQPRSHINEDGTEDPEDMPDIIVVALQEICPLIMAVDLTDTVTRRHQTAWRESMRDTLAPFGDYALVAEANMIGLQLMVFVSAQQKQHVKDVRTGVIRCGKLGAGNKGAVAASFCIYTTHICCTNAHLAAGFVSSAVQERKQNFENIMSNLRLYADGATDASNQSGNESTMVAAQDVFKEKNLKTAESLNAAAAILENEADKMMKQHHDDRPKSLFEFDLVLWAGDFNSRLWVDTHMVDAMPREDIFCEVTHHWEQDTLPDFLAEHDELSIQRRHGGAFSTFEEADICFLPTYKVRLEEQERLSYHVTLDRLERNPSLGSSAVVQESNVPASPSNRAQRAKSMSPTSGGSPPSATKDDSDAKSFDDGVPVDNAPPENKKNKNVTPFYNEVYLTQREPAWCDRVLWHTRSGTAATFYEYDRVEGVRCADHRPVRLGLSVCAQDIGWDKFLHLYRQGLQEGATTPTTSPRMSLRSGSSSPTDNLGAACGDEPIRSRGRFDTWDQGSHSRGWHDVADRRGNRSRAETWDPGSSPLRAEQGNRHRLESTDSSISRIDSMLVLENTSYDRTNMERLQPLWRNPLRSCLPPGEEASTCSVQ